MDYELTLSDDQMVAVTRFYAPITLKLLETFAEELDGFARQHGITRFLHDVRGVKNEGGPGGDYEFASRLGEFGRSRTDRIAIVIAPGDISHAFFETAARNRGFNIRLFERYEDAIAWLTG
ncbi:MAG: STAS/SEC14 domain-containing protein [Candidatus Hydrogenedentes bacterium]|nr:STAS/SEC14 domain-containing protein [Candidatus Hydrogenedentota bacterium]